MIPKFRAWVKTQKRIIETDHLFDIHFKYEVITVKQDDRGLKGFAFDGIELMQSTGLKDKNGQEIFEGDILGIETDEGILNVNVFWDSKHALFMFESEIHNEKELLAELVEDNTYPFKILGNIYENPELLEGKE